MGYQVHHAYLAITVRSPLSFITEEQKHTLLQKIVMGVTENFSEEDIQTLPVALPHAIRIVTSVLHVMKHYKAILYTP